MIFRSTDNPENLRGPNLSGVWSDEAGLTPPEAYTVCIGRLREGGRMGWYSATFTPNGRAHWTYDVFARNPGPDVALVRSRTADNPFLPAEFEAAVRGQYTTHLGRQELDGEFLDAPGALFKTHWLPVRDAAPSHPRRRVRFWDLASTEQRDANDPDYTAGVLMASAHDGSYCVLDVARERLSPQQVKRLLRATAERDGADVEVWIEQEGGSGGKAWANELIGHLAGFKVRAQSPEGNKVERANPFAAQAEAGNVSLLRGRWNDAYLDELTAFPGGRHDDMVDGSSGAFSKLAPPAAERKWGWG